MGDQYNFNAPTQVAAAGSQATANATTNQQVNLNSVDIRELQRQLELLHTAMGKCAKTPEENAQVDTVAQASRAAAAGDKVGMLQHLKRAGSWTLNIAKDIGVAVAAEIIKNAVT